MLLFLFQHTTSGCNSQGRFTRSERSQKDTARTSEGQLSWSPWSQTCVPSTCTEGFDDFAADTGHSSENSKVSRQSLWHRHPKSCPPSCRWYCRDTEKAWPGWERCGFKRENARAAEADGGCDRGWPVWGLPCVQGVPRWSPGGDLGGGGGADGGAKDDRGWVWGWCCPPRRRTFVK